MIYRIVGSERALLLFNVSVLFGTVGLMTEQVQFLTTNYELNFISSEVGMEDTISILIASFGAFLSNRRFLIEKIFPNEIPGPIDQFDQYSKDIGMKFILLAMLIESLDLIFLTLNNWGINGIGFKFFEIIVFFMINISASVLFIKFGVQLLKK